MIRSTHRSTYRRLTSALALATVVLALTGCEARDRAGGDADQDVTVLTFAQPNDGGAPEALELWADQVSDLSDGSLEIEFQDGWRLGEPLYESATIDDIRAGEVDLGWVGARALDRAGISSFQALLAPMLVDSQDLQSKVFEEGIPGEMLEDVAARGDGVVGIGVLAGPMRKLLGIEKPFVRPADFTGTTVGMQDSEIAERAFATLGASSKALPSGAKDFSSVDAYEQQLQSIWGNQYQQHARYLTANLDLWPRPLVLLANEESLAALTDSQQDALREASDASIVGSLDAARKDDESFVDQICASGLDVRQASDADLEELEAAFVPLFDELREDERTAMWLDRIAELKSSVGAPPDTMTCEAGAGSDVAGPLPEGTYRNVLTSEDVTRGCTPGEPGAANLLDWGVVDHVQELVISGSQVSQTTYEVGHPEAQETGWSGTYRTFRDTIELLESGTTDPLSATWTFDGTELVISDMRTEACDHPTVWTTHPWVAVEENGAAALVGSWSTTFDEVTSSESTLGTYTMVFRNDGVMQFLEPSGDVGFHGEYSVFRGRLQIVGDPDTVSTNFTIDGDELTFTDLTVPGCDDCEPYKLTWEFQPWLRN